MISISYSSLKLFHGFHDQSNQEIFKDEQKDGLIPSTDNSEIQKKEDSGEAVNIVPSSSETEGNSKEDHHHHHSSNSPLTPYILLIALGFHGFFEGLALGLQSTIQNTVFLLVAIIAHKWAEALTLGISFVKARTEKKQIIILCSVFSAIGPLGVLTGFFMSGEKIVEGIFLSLSTGTFLYVACSEVIVEEFESSDQKYPKYLLYLVGAIFTAVLAIIEHINETHEDH